MTTVYIDVLFIVNFIVNLMLYLSSCIIRRKKIVAWRISCAAAAGAVCSCAFFISEIEPVIRNIIAVGIYALCSWLVMGYDTWRDFIKNATATLFCAFVFAGVFFLIYRYADIGSVVVFNNNVLYIDIPVFALLCTSGACFALIALMSKAFIHVLGADAEYEVTVGLDNNVIKAQAKMDTGNAMIDPISGCPVILADKKRMAALFPRYFEEFVTCGDISKIEPQYHLRLRMVMCKTATGDGLLPALRPDYMQFICDGKTVIIHNILIAVSKTDLGGYGLLLSPIVLKEARNDNEHH
jgi:stage II sporulation protein GA (sporulation sigma-E factor processing peptidase)